MRRHPSDERDFEEQDEERREEHPDRTHVGHQSPVVGGVTPSFFIASSGQPFHSGTNVLPMYWRSATPTFEDQYPDAVRSRKLLKKATPAENSGLASPG